MQTAQKYVQNSVITSFLVTDFIEDDSTIQVIMFIAVLLVIIRKETYTLTRKSPIILLFKGSQPLRAMVTKLNKPPRSFQFFFFSGRKKHRYYWKLKLKISNTCN